MPYFMRGDELKPLKGVQCPEKRRCHALVGATEDGPLDRAQVADQFASRPAPFGRPGFPLVGRNGIGHRKEFALGTSQILEDGRK